MDIKVNIAHKKVNNFIIFHFIETVKLNVEIKKMGN